MNPDLNKLMEQAKQMQEQMQAAQKELENLMVVGEAGGGIVQIHMTGRHDVKKVSIDEDLVDGDINMLEDLVAAAVNDAVKKVEDSTRGKMSELTKGLNLPGDLGDLG